MPLPLGHAAIAWAAYETVKPSQRYCPLWARGIFIAVLANLPDLDVLLGLAFGGNGSAYHRGPSHSLLFAVICGCLASHLWRLRPGIPKFGFGLCSLLIFSHVAADMLLTNTPVSLFWPLEVHWCPGHSSWIQVFDMVLFRSIQDAGIVFGALLYGGGLRTLRGGIRGVLFIRGNHYR
jgi:membrane-bound metal-dependent hydrolase YbcI (DUF457 family)